MWIYKIIGILLFGKALIGKFDFEASRLDVAQGSKYYEITKMGTVDIPEISGLVSVGNHFLVISDSGDEIIYLLDENLLIVDTLLIPNVKKVDWEALAIDSEGNFYIGDIGNNLNRRKDLKIHKVMRNHHIIHLSISYEQQKDFPPVKRNMNYDGESMFWNNRNLHLFSKNRGKKCVKHYIMPDKGSDYTLSPLEELKLNEMITGAAANSANDLVVLSGYGKLYFFKLAEDGKVFSNPVLLIETLRFGQNEAVAFLNDSTVIVANESGKFYKVEFSLP